MIPENCIANPFCARFGRLRARIYTTSRYFLQTKPDSKLYLRFLLNKFCGLHNCGVDFVILAFNKKKIKTFFFYIAVSFHKLWPLKQRSVSEAFSRPPTNEVFYCVNKPRFQTPQNVTLNDKITRVIRNKRGSIGPSYLICVHGDLLLLNQCLVGNIQRKFQN